MSACFYPRSRSPENDLADRGSRPSLGKFVSVEDFDRNSKVSSSRVRVESRMFSSQIRSTPVLESLLKYIGVLEYWSIEVLEYWNIEVSEYINVPL